MSLPRALVVIAVALGAGVATTHVVSRSGRSGERRDPADNGSISYGWKRYPPPGTVVYRTMGVESPIRAHVEHSGIYVGDGWFVERQRNGMIERVRLNAFMDEKRSLFVSARDGSAFGKPTIAKRAKARIGRPHASGKLSDSNEYCLITNNCHTFCSYCISGRRSADSTLSKLKRTARSSLDVSEWLEWQYGD